MAIVVQIRDKRTVERPIGAKLQVIALVDPAWVHALESLIDWKLEELKKPH